MYEHRCHNDCVGTLLAHGKDKNDLCGAVFLYQIKDSLLAYVEVKIQVRQSKFRHPIGRFFSSAAKMETFVINLNLYFVFRRS